MISHLQDLSRAGAAVLVHVSPPRGTRWVRVARRLDAVFPDDPDPAAWPDDTALILDGAPGDAALDWRGVRPGVAHWYAVYALVAGDWRRGAPRSIVPTNQTHAPYLDSLDVIRERVEVGLNALVDAGLLHHPRGRFHVLTAPPQTEDVVFPAATVQLEQASPDPQHQYVSSFIDEDRLADGNWREYLGGRSRYSVEVGIWSLNPDERRLLRLCLRDVLLANRDVLEFLSIQEMEASFMDTEDFQSFNAPLYRTTARLSYLAPDAIQLDVAAIRAIQVARPGVIDARTGITWPE